jgi:hypothetical protein
LLSHIFWGIFCFVLLIPYIYEIFCLLKPETIIMKLSEEIDADSSSEEDHLQPIVDIVISSLMKYDYETMRYGIKAIEVKICHILEKRTLKKLNWRLYEIEWRMS